MIDCIDRQKAILELQSYDNNGFINKATRNIPEILSPKNVPSEDVIERHEVERMIDNIRKEVLEYVNDLDIANEVCTVFDNHITELKNSKKRSYNFYYYKRWENTI